MSGAVDSATKTVPSWPSSSCTHERRADASTCRSPAAAPLELGASDAGHGHPQCHPRFVCRRRAALRRRARGRGGLRMVGRGRRHPRRRRRIDAPRRRGRCRLTRSCGASCRSSSGWRRPARSAVDRHLQGGRRARGGRARRRRSSTTSAASSSTTSWARSSPQTGAALVLMHNRGRSRDMYRAGGLRDASDRDRGGAASRRSRGRIDAGVDRDGDHRRSRAGVREARRAQLRGARQARRDRRARSADPVRGVAQVVPEGGDRATRPADSSATGARPRRLRPACSSAPTSCASSGAGDGGRGPSGATGSGPRPLNRAGSGERVPVRLERLSRRDRGTRSSDKLCGAWCRLPGQHPASPTGGLVGSARHRRWCRS